MVKDEGQLYTIEGVAAAVLILTTVYLVLTTTTVFTPGEMHINDMQLEQLGNDVLAVMDMSPIWNTPGGSYPQSPLETYIENNQSDEFTRMFLQYSNQTTTGWVDDLQFNAYITYREGDQVKSTPVFAKTRDYNRENVVRVTRWVNINNGTWFGGETRKQTVLVEVLLWRG